MLICRWVRQLGGPDAWNGACMMGGNNPNCRPGLMDLDSPDYDFGRECAELAWFVKDSLTKDSCTTIQHTSPLLVGFTCCAARRSSVSYSKQSSVLTKRALRLQTGLTAFVISLLYVATPFFLLQRPPCL